MLALKTLRNHFPVYLFSFILTCNYFLFLSWERVRVRVNFLTVFECEIRCNDHQRLFRKSISIGEQLNKLGNARF